MTLEAVAFSLVAVFCLVLAILTVSARSAVRAAFCFGATTLGIAGLFLQLGTPLLGASEILIGVSGSALLCLIVGVSTNLKSAATVKPVRIYTFFAAVLCGGLFFLLCWILPAGLFISEGEQTGSVAGFLVGDFLLPLLLSGFAFLVVAVGTSVLTNPGSAAAAASEGQQTS